MKICPICETENKPQATHCEVCGERLEAPAPGEVVSPEESVSAQIAAAPPAPEDGGGFFVREDPPAAADAPAAEDAPASPEPAAEAPKEPALSSEQLEAEFAALLEKSKGSASPDPEPVSAPPASPEPIAAAAPEPAAPPTPEPARPAEPPARIVSSGIPEARIVIYINREPAHTHPIVNDETLIGRYDPVSGSYPEIDLTELDVEANTSRKHAYIYRMGEDHYLYPVSNAGTQLNSELLDMGQKKKLEDGDIIILAASLAMKFHIDT